MIIGSAIGISCCFWQFLTVSWCISGSQWRWQIELKLFYFLLPRLLTCPKAAGPCQSSVRQSGSCLCLNQQIGLTSFPSTTPTRRRPSLWSWRDILPKCQRKDDLRKSLTAGIWRPQNCSMIEKFKTNRFANVSLVPNCCCLIATSVVSQILNFACLMMEFAQSNMQN